MTNKLLYKGDTYTFRELWNAKQKSKTLYADGEVSDATDGVILFDIKDIAQEREKYLHETISRLDELENNKSSVRMKLQIEKDKISLAELEELYHKQTINVEQMKKLIVLKYSSSELKKTYSFSSYCFLNKNIPLPNLSYDELGKFYVLIHGYLSHKNNLLTTKKDLRSRPFSMDDMKSLFNIKDSAFYSFVKRLKDNNIISHIEIKDKKYIMINPIYVLNGLITPLSYVVFKEDVDKYFPLIPQELRDLWIMEFNLTTIPEGTYTT